MSANVIHNTVFYWLQIITYDRSLVSGLSPTQHLSPTKRGGGGGKEVAHSKGWEEEVHANLSKFKKVVCEAFTSTLAGSASKTYPYRGMSPALDRHMDRITLSPKTTVARGWSDDVT